MTGANILLANKSRKYGVVHGYQQQPVLDIHERFDCLGSKILFSSLCTT